MQKKQDNNKKPWFVQIEELKRQGSIAPTVIKAVKENDKVILEKDVPIPAVANDQKRTSRVRAIRKNRSWPLPNGNQLDMINSMEIGDNIFLEEIIINPIAHEWFRCKKQEGWRICTRKVVDKGMTGIRVWRLS